MEGDVYLVMQNGDVKELAANRVLLLKGDPPEGASLTAACKAVRNMRFIVSTDPELVTLSRDNFRKVNRATNYDEVVPDQELNEGARDHLRVLDESNRKMIALMASTLVAQSPTGVNAHYRFASVAEGPYILHTATTLGTKHYEWWVPVSVRGRGSQQFDLDNSALENGIAECRPIEREAASPSR